MLTRRSLLGTAGAGLGAAIAGCLESGKSPGSIGPTVVPATFLSRDLPVGAVAGTDNRRPTEYRAWVAYCDAAALRSQGPQVGDGFRRGTELENVGAEKQRWGIDRRDEGLLLSLTAVFEDGLRVGADSTVYLGDVNVSQFAAPEAYGEPDGSVSGLALHDVAQSEVLAVAEDVYVFTSSFMHHRGGEYVADGYAATVDGLARRTIKWLGTPAHPEVWVGDVIDRCRPFQYVEMDVSHRPHSHRPSNVEVEAYHVDGNRCTKRLARGYPEPADKAQAWSRQDHVEWFDGTVQRQVTVEEGDRSAVAAVELPIEETAIAH